MTEAAPVQPESAPVVDETPIIDPAQIKPEEYVCFGHLEAGHPECEKCQFKEPCGKKAGK